MAERGIESTTVLGFEADFSGLKSDAFSGLVILGGAQSAYETETYPFLRSEMDLCHAFLAEGKPIAGFCLGAQILAYALGGEVLSGKQKEIGWYDLKLSNGADSDPLLNGHPETLLAYHFHGDVIRPPSEAVTLASSALTECQLFRYGKSAYGFQYHAEADMALIEAMCRNNESYMASNGFSADAIIEQSTSRSVAFEQANRAVLNKWLDLL
nr:type 1 glutamine amidotransferase [Hyphomicrobium methylovorum]